jgi:hypothetical protein
MNSSHSRWRSIQNGARRNAQKWKPSRTNTKREVCAMSASLSRRGGS